MVSKERPHSEIGKIEVRNRMFDEYQRNPRCASIKMKLQRSRRALQQAIRKAKDDWIIMQTDRVNDGVCGAITGSKVAWDADTPSKHIDIETRIGVIKETPSSDTHEIY